MRKIKTIDVFKLARIIRLSGAKEDIAESLRATQSGEAPGEVGINLMMTLITVCGNEEVEKSIYELIGGVAEEEPDDIMNKDLDKLTELLRDIAEQNNLSNFFETAVKSA